MQAVGKTQRAQVPGCIFWERVSNMTFRYSVRWAELSKEDCGQNDMWSCKIHPCSDLFLWSPKGIDRIRPSPTAAPEVEGHSDQCKWWSARWKVKGLSWRRQREDESPLMRWPRDREEEEIRSTRRRGGGGVGGCWKGKTTSSFRVPSVWLGRWGEYQYH